MKLSRKTCLLQRGFFLLGERKKTHLFVSFYALISEEMSFLFGKEILHESDECKRVMCHRDDGLH